MPWPVKWLILWYIPVGIMNLWGYTEILPDLFTAESQLTVDKLKQRHFIRSFNY